MIWSLWVPAAPSWFGLIYLKGKGMQTRGLSPAMPGHELPPAPPTPPPPRVCTSTKLNWKAEPSHYPGHSVSPLITFRGWHVNSHWGSQGHVGPGRSRQVRTLSLQVFSIIVEQSG